MKCPWFRNGKMEFLINSEVTTIKQNLTLRLFWSLLQKNQSLPNFGKAGSQLEIRSRSEYLKFVSYVESKLDKENPISCSYKAQIQAQLEVARVLPFLHKYWFFPNSCRSQISKIQIKYYSSRVLIPDSTLNSTPNTTHLLSFFE